MYSRGHIGVGLLLYAPFAAILIADHYLAPVVLGWGLTIFFSTLPDIDMRLPGVPHRGPTHTVWFAALITLVTGAIGGVVAGFLVLKGVFGPQLWGHLGLSGAESALGLQYLAQGDPELAAVVTGVFVGFVSGLAIISHLLGDVLTPMGIRPFTPFSGQKYTLNWTKAANTVANELLHFIGEAALVGAFFVGSPAARQFLIHFVH